MQPLESVVPSSSAMQPSSMVSGKVQKFTVVFPRAILGLKLRKKSLSVTAFTTKFPWNDEPEKRGIRYDDQVLEINGVAVQTRRKLLRILKNGVPPFEILFSRRVARKSHVSLSHVSHNKKDMAGESTMEMTTFEDSNEPGPPETNTTPSKTEREVSTDMDKSANFAGNEAVANVLKGIQGGRQKLRKAYQGVAHIGEKDRASFRVQRMKQKSRKMQRIKSAVRPKKANPTVA